MASQTPQYRVLIVDDDHEFRLSLGKTLAKQGYGVELAADGVEALRAVQNGAFDLVITDHRLPGLPGIELLAEIRRCSPHSMVILVTAYGDEAVQCRAREAGAFAYLDKPIKREEILKLVAQALQQRQPQVNPDPSGIEDQ
ncbi:MAG: response regulator [candidate division KSB1 bacterium]|nr:response regulator [candidate division KSB1 bacterium]MDZ7294384.1 response regulator [candidate division KSB1 bacterium]MDZ7338409.1 response regulator [candidate division KSB1 bacterium]MDZ7385090.1 response regulator [candidate division KSB1 bacterium]MDZ7391651.1 response regulator [candidate division KSB1 bacterium]